MDFGSGDLIRAFGALATGIGGLLIGWAAMKRANREGKQKCEEEKSDETSSSD
jgi:hypothetical protein